MNKHFSCRIIALAAFGCGLFPAPSHAAEKPACNCTECACDQCDATKCDCIECQCSKCDAEHCRPPKTMVEAEANLAAADDALQAAMSAVERAKQNVDSSTTTDQPKAAGADATATRNAASALSDAKTALATAQLNDSCRLCQWDQIDRRLAEARTWRYGLAGGGALAASADGWTRAGGEVLLLWHPRIRREWGLLLRLERSNDPQDQVQKWTEGQIRWGITGEITSVMFGLGMAQDSFAHLARTNQRAITGHASFGLRYGQWLRFYNGTFFSDARVFMEPWIPTGSGHTTVFFGIELLGGIGFNRIGKPRDLRYGDEFVHPPTKD